MVGIPLVHQQADRVKALYLRKTPMMAGIVVVNAAIKQFIWKLSYCETNVKSVISNKMPGSGECQRPCMYASDGG